MTMRNDMESCMFMVKANQSKYNKETCMLKLGCLNTSQIIEVYTSLIQTHIVKNALTRSANSDILSWKYLNLYNNK